MSAISSLFIYINNLEGLWVMYLTKGKSVGNVNKLGLSQHLELVDHCSYSTHPDILGETSDSDP